MLKGHEAYLKKNILWMKTIPYPNTKDPTWSQSHQWRRRSTPKSTSKSFCSALRYSIVIPRFIPRANKAQS